MGIHEAQKGKDMFNSIDEVLEDLKAGNMIIVMDDEGRENEGDLLCAAEFITPEKINFFCCKFAQKTKLSRKKLIPKNLKKKLFFEKTIF